MSRVFFFFYANKNKPRHRRGKQGRRGGDQSSSWLCLPKPKPRHLSRPLPYTPQCRNTYEHARDAATQKTITLGHRGGILVHDKHSPRLEGTCRATTVHKTPSGLSRRKFSDLRWTTELPTNPYANVGHYRCKQPTHFMTVLVHAYASRCKARASAPRQGIGLPMGG